jgi:hypothetical protein
MANSLSDGFIEVWAKEYQTVWHKINVAKMIADLSFNSQLTKGDVLNRVYRSSDPDDPQLDPYSRGSDITIQDITDTKETLTIDSEYAKGIYVDDFDQVQSNYQIAAAYGKDNAIFLSNKIDGDVLGEYSNATNTVDDGVLGGTTGNGITLTTSNVLKVVAECKKFLRKENIPVEDLCGVISPEFEQVLIEYGAGRDTQGGDMYNRNGYMRDFYGFKLYVSNQAAGSAVLQLATQPTDGNTVTINGVVFTFKTTLGSTAGNVLIGADADAARLNLTTLINTPGTTTAQGVALSAADQRKLMNVTATNDATANTMTVVQTGVGVITVSETLTAAADIWTTALQKQHCVFGKRGFTTLVMQKYPSIKPQDAQKRFGKYILNGTLYGYATFTDQKPQFVNVELDSSSF